MQFWLVLVLGGATARFALEVTAQNRPGLGKEAKGGEDAWLAREDLIAVADGVGGWNEHGVDPALFSRALMRHLEELLAERPDALTDPKELLVEAVARNVETGTSTLVVATVDATRGLLRVASIGDSGYLLLTRGEEGYAAAFRSKEQQHSFNFPWQVGTHGDDPADAVLDEHPLRAGDLLVVGSDGLFDNLYDADIVELVNAHAEHVDELAQALVERAFELSIRKDYESPFSVHARDSGVDFLGGKNDDITVVVGRVSSAAGL